MTNPFHPYPMPKLTVELVPAPLWGFNLRQLFTQAQWRDLRTACYKRAGHTCEVCGDLRGRPPEAHEIWEYDDLKKVQTLKGLICLCNQCHKVKHIGFALSQGQETFIRALRHLAVVNEWPIELAGEYVDRQFQIHEIRSELTWTQDLSWADKIQTYIANVDKHVREKRGQLATDVLKRLRNTDAHE